MDLKQRKWYCDCLDDEIPSDEIVFLLTYFVLSNKDGIYEVVDIKEKGRPVNPPEYLVSLLIYGAFRHVDGTDELAEMARFHQKFRYACSDLQPSGRVLRKFMQDYGNLFKQMFSYYLKFSVYFRIN